MTKLVSSSIGEPTAISKALEEMRNEIKSDCARKFAPLIEYQNTSVRAADDIVQLYKRITVNEKFSAITKGELDIQVVQQKQRQTSLDADSRVDTVQEVKKTGG